MSLPHYVGTYDGFSSADLEADPLDGSLKSGLNACYYLTDDMATCPGDGIFSFSDRDDIIAKAGGRGSPADVESTLLEHAAVAESGMLAKPDKKRGNIIKAYVVVKADQQLVNRPNLQGELQELVHRRLSEHELPKTPSGKIQRFVLRHQANARPRT